MYLFDKEDNTFKKYELIPNLSKIEEFKYQEMQNIPFNERVFYAETNDKNLLEIKAEQSNKTYNIEEIDYSKRFLLFLKKYHRLLTYKELNESEIYPKIKKINHINYLMERYYSGEYDKGMLVKVKKDNDSFHLLVNGFVNLFCMSNYTYYNKHSNKRYLDNIIHITKHLYNLHLFLREKYQDLNDAEIIKILELFEFNTTPIETVKIESIKNLNDSNEWYDKSVEKSQKILRLLNNK